MPNQQYGPMPHSPSPGAMKGQSPYPGQQTPYPAQQPMPSPNYMNMRQKGPGNGITYQGNHQFFPRGNFNGGPQAINPPYNQQAIVSIQSSIMTPDE